MQRRAGRSLRREVARTTRRLVALAVASVLVASVTGVLLVQANDRTEQLLTAARAARISHEAMLEELTAVRGFLLGEDESFLAEYQSIGIGVARPNAELTAAVQGHPHLADLALSARSAAAAWRAHARGVFRERDELQGVSLADYVIRDRALFDRYTGAQDDLVAAMRAEQIALSARERSTLVGGVGLQLVVLTAFTVVAVRHRRHLVRGVVDPVHDLEHTIASMAGGDLGARVTVNGYAELAAAGTGLATLADALSNEQVRARLRADLLALQTARFRELLHTSQEISGTPDVAFVVAAVTASARRVTGWPDAEVRLADSRESRPSDAAHVAGGLASFPMVASGAVNGVLEVSTPDERAVLPSDVVEVVAVLAGQAAAAVEAARLHARLADESRRDPLTSLPNRRSLDEDLAHELARCERYRRPLSVVLVDLDHFKVVNDTFGHGVGDDVLVATADLLRSMLRATDTAYRFGGEEMVLLLRETGIDDASEVAERLRVALEEHGPAGVQVTGSFGVAEAVQQDEPDAFLARADAALYRAKRSGRNRVVAAGPSLVLD